MITQNCSITQVIDMLENIKSSFVQDVVQQRWSCCTRIIQLGLYFLGTNRFYSGIIYNQKVHMHFQSINMCLFKKPKLFIFRHYFTQSRLMNLEHTPITETNQLFQIISTFHLKSIHNMASFLEYYICSNPSGFFSLTKHHGCSS